jgi:hypothetical protein
MCTVLSGSDKDMYHCVISGSNMIELHNSRYCRERTARVSSGRMWVAHVLTGREMIAYIFIRYRVDSTCIIR